MNRKILTAFAAMAVLLSPLAAETIYENAFQKAGDIEEFSKDPNIKVEGGALVIDFPERISYETINLPLESKKCSGRFLRISCEACADNILPSKKAYEGIKLEISLKSASGKSSWGSIRFPKGSWKWKKFESVFPAFDDLDTANLAIGMQNSAGKAQIRNLKIETVGVPVNIRSVANMEYRDQVANDGKGGWTDQGPKQDGSTFGNRLWSYTYAGIPLDPIPGGKTVLTMYSEHFKNGPKEVSIPVKASMKAKTLYLLHTAAWAVNMKGDNIGFVILKDKNGKTQKIEIKNKRDVVDWYRQSTNLPNGYGVMRGRTGNGKLAGIYLSRFVINPDMDEITEVKFQSASECIWLIISATLLPVDIPLPNTKELVIKADSTWLPMAKSEKNLIVPGSALDLSRYQPPGTVDELGRIIIKDGHFVYEKDPSQKVRFLTEAIHPGSTIPKTHAEIDLFVQEIRRNGYNMIRTHFLDGDLMGGRKHDFDFRPDLLDRFDYMIYCMKKYGVYLNFDCMTSWTGYTPEFRWMNRDPEKSFKSRIYFDPAVRANWRGGVEKLLTRINPYTKKRLVDDPVLVMAVAFNEQEFAKWNGFDKTWFIPRWQKFLRNKYGTIESLNTAWKKQFKSFKEITGAENNSADYAEFLLPYENELAQWYKKQLKEIGYRGVFTNDNCGKDMYYNLIRSQYDFTAMNHYHAHPSNVHLPYSFMEQTSDIAKKALTLRNCIGTRQPNKPFVITEHHFVFWNKFRYEQGFSFGAYSAFQDFDALTIHATPVSLHTPKFVSTFEVFTDPISKAAEFMTFFLFRRGDVKTGKPTVRIRMLGNELRQQDGSCAEALSDTQSLPSLMVGESIEATSSVKEQIPLRKGEISYKLGETNSTKVNQAGFSGTTDNPAASTEEVLLHLRKTGALPQNNRSNGKNRFETSTGEIYLDSARSYMQINTPRLQGICGLAGTTAKLSDFSIEKMTADGNLAIVSVDGMKPIRDSERMVLVYATNVLNTNMKFSDPGMGTLIDIGSYPALLRRGSFEISLRSSHASKLCLYPLDMAGNRLKKILPVSSDAGTARFSIDTGKDGAAIYFEICKESKP